MTMVRENTNKRIPCGLSLSAEFIKEIDSKRGDISRSKYVQKLIKKGMNLTTESLTDFPQVKSGWQKPMIDITNSEQEEFKICPGIGCDNRGIYKLKVILVNRCAYFCAKHKKELEECGLVASDDNSKTMEGS